MILFMDLDPLASGEARRYQISVVWDVKDLDPLASGEARPVPQLDTLLIYDLDPLASGEARQVNLIIFDEFIII